MAIVGALFGLLRRVGITRGLARTHLWHDVREVLRERVQARSEAPRPTPRTPNALRSSQRSDIQRLTRNERRPMPNAQRPMPNA